MNTKAAKVKDSIEDTIDKVLKEETAQGEAVKSLITVKEREVGKLGSDIELKTDLDEKGVCLHTAVDMMSNILEMDKASFRKNCIIGNLTHLKERKLLSKDRKSRQEIVEVAKNPDMNLMQEPMQQSAVRRFFTGRRMQQ